MPFGKHKGKKFDAIPLTYLEWVIDNCDLREPLLSRIAGYLKDPSIASELEREKSEEEFGRDFTPFDASGG